MNSQQLGTKLVELIRAHDYETIYGAYYQPDVESIEANGEVYAGLDAIAKKNEWWASAMEVHSESVEGPFPHGEDCFGLIFEMDLTDREKGFRFTMKELGIYDVKDGKVARERFFYNMG